MSLNYVKRPSRVLRMTIGYKMTYGDSPVSSLIGSVPINRRVWPL